VTARDNDSIASKPRFSPIIAETIAGVALFFDKAGNALGHFLPKASAAA
jgi:hypothetical protein